jgi:hypothetical protein
MILGSMAMDKGKGKGRVENLRPVKTTAEAKARGKQGGIKSGEVKRERKLLSAMYVDLIAKGFEVEGERLSLDEVASAILSRKDSASVSMLKEIREATEGNKTKLVGEDGGPVEISIIKRVIVETKN